VTGTFQSNRIAVWDINSGDVVYVLDAKMNCKNLRISGIQGVEAEMLEFFADRGAILDEEQQLTLAELRRKRAEEEQRKAAEEAVGAERPKKARTRRKQPSDKK
jgi:hypothetical protein